MNILLVMIPLSIVLLAIAAFAFSRAVDRNQFDGCDYAQLLPLLDKTEPADERKDEATP